MLSALLLAPAVTWAQGATSITGVVRDTSGGILPGVTVEAASPALIEKVRSVVTDAEGRYRIVELRPGAYSVTFTLPGFSTLRREGIELTTGFTATVNADLAVGSLEETITVTGEAPVVDTQNVRQQAQYSRDTRAALPGSGRLATLSSLIPGITMNDPTSHSVGGVSDLAQTNYTVHGAPTADAVVDGMNITMPSLFLGVFVYNQLNFQEVVVETSGIGADRDTGGMQVNMVGRDGGNTFSGGASFAFTGPGLENSNFNDDLAARGLQPNSSLKKFYDVGGAFGGPIRRDRVWFFGAYRTGVTQQFQQGNYYNKRQGTLFYEPDLSRPAHTDTYSKDYTFRLTWQAAAKHKIVFASSFQPNCNCVMFLLNPSGGIPTAPEATAQHTYNPQAIPTLSWTYPVTNRVLIDAGASANIQHQVNKRQPGVGTDTIQVTDQGLNYRYGSRANALTTAGSYITVPRWQYQQRFAVSYVTGSHNFKTGMSLRHFRTGDLEKNRDPNQINQARDYTFRNGVPVSVRIWATPTAAEEAGRDVGFYAQDQWTVRRATVNLGLRFNDASAWVPEQVLAPGPFVPERIYPAMKNVPHWRNLNPRVGVAYDLFGTSRTAVKASLGRYNPALRIAAENPANNQATSTSRTWNDVNGNYVPDCDLLNPNASGECGPWSDRLFGQARQTNTRNATDSREGFNVESYNWQGSVSVQHELRPGIGLNVGYFRTWYGGFLATDNLAVTPADHDEYCITAPVDSRLPNSGQQLCGLFDVKPALFGQVDNLITQTSHYGNRSEVYNGVDVTLNARFGQGGQFSGGLNVGRMVIDDCVVVDSPQSARDGFCKVTPPWSASSQVKFMAVYPMPWDFQTSLIYQNSPGVPITAGYVARNAEIAPSLGRNLAACGTTGPACNATVTIPLIRNQSMFEDRLQQVDLRLARLFRVGNIRVRGNLDIHNIFNASTILNLNRGYGPAWLNVVQIMGGRLVKVGAQLDF